MNFFHAKISISLADLEKYMDAKAFSAIAKHSEKIPAVVTICEEPSFDDEPRVFDIVDVCIPKFTNRSLGKHNDAVYDAVENYVAENEDAIIANEIEQRKNNDKS